MENNNVNDKGKIMVLISLIIAVSILLVVFVFIAVIDLTHKEAQSRISTTTRRTIETENTTENVEEGMQDDPTSTVTTTVSTSTTGSKKTTAQGSTAVKPTTKLPEETVIPSHSYAIAYDKTTYPDAVDSWEWEVVNLINQERRNNGLSEVYVAKDLRNMAEEAAYMYYANNNDASSLQAYLNGYAYLYMHSNLDIDARSLYQSTQSSTKITTNSEIKYVGVGVLVKDTDTHYYVIIYE